MSEVQITPGGAAVTESASPPRRHGRMRAAIANALVGLYKEHYGRGPTMARTIVDDRFVICVLEGGLTRNELTLIEHGQHELVSRYRARFNAIVDPIARQALERLTGRRVISHHAQLVLDPARSFEIFELDAPLEGLGDLG